MEVSGVKNEIVELPVGADAFHAQIILQSLTARGFEVQLWDANSHAYGPLENYRLVVRKPDLEDVLEFLHSEGLLTQSSM